MVDSQDQWLTQWEAYLVLLCCTVVLFWLTGHSLPPLPCRLPIGGSDDDYLEPATRNVVAE